MDKDTLKRLSKELDIPEDTILKVYKSYWKFIKDTIKDLPLKEDITEEEYNKYKTSFNIPYLGKLACPYKRFTGMKKKLKYFK